ncbi:histone-lysine N-methyltransferase SETMAR [Trichonephila clavipes]|nr:histone-lysine N-methyltransferase SETMAR [Trichonephila clavipes]
MGAEFLFMDDNARPHRASIVDECLQSEDITRMDWSAYSPDLNPIEHVCDMLGRRIAARRPPPTCLLELWRALLDEWCNIPQDQIENLILSMPRRCIVYQHAVELGTTVNDSYYTNVLQTMVQYVKRKRSLLRNGFLLHHNNARPHISRCVLDVSQQNNVEILPHPPYSPGLAPGNFCLFPQLKKPLQGKRFASNKACVKDAEAVLKQVSQNGLLHVFKKWIELWDKCITCHGSYLEKNHANDDD